MKKCLITGATGLIGKEVIPFLQQDHQDIYIVNRHNNKIDLPGHHVYCDLEKLWTVDQFPEKIDSIIHLAQSEHFRDFPEFSEKIFNVNTWSTVRLLEYARKAGAKNFILASSGGIYGFGEKEFKEDEPIIAKGDLGFYLGTKLSSEILAENYTSYMNIIILRFFFVYGPRQKNNMLIPRLINSVKKGIPIILQGSDGIKINPTHVSDAARAVYQALDLSDSAKINIGGPSIMSLRQICEEIGEQLGIKPIFSIQEDTQPRHLIGDIDKMSRLLGAPKISFKEGIQKFLQEK